MNPSPLSRIPLFCKNSNSETSGALLAKRTSKAPSLPALCCAASLSLLASAQAFADTVAFAPGNTYDYNEAQADGGLTIELAVNLTLDYGGVCTFDVPVRDFLDQGEGGTVQGTASAGQDYILNTDTLSFVVNGAGTYTSTVSISLLSDTEPEYLENIKLYLGNPVVTGLGDCSPFTIDTTLAQDVTIYDRYVTTERRLNLSVLPGETATGTFLINTGNGNLSLTIFSEQEASETSPVTFSQKTVQQEDAGNTFPIAANITYNYAVPANAVAGTTISDTITIQPTGEFLPVQVVTIPVSITVAALAEKVELQPLEAAWASLCASAAEGSPLAGYCADHPTLNEKEKRDLSPEEMAAMASGGINMTKDLIKTVLYQQQARRAGVTGVDLNRLTLNIDGENLPLGRMLTSYLNEQTGGAAGDPGIGGRWSLFASGRMNTGEKDASSNDDGYDFDTKGMTLGADYRLNEQVILGGALGYAKMNSDFGNNGGDLDIEASTLVVYGSFFTKNNFYVDGSALYTLHNFDFTRKINSFNTQTDGDTDGDQYAFSLSAGKDFNVGALSMSPYGRFDYIKNNIDSYRENGGNGLALNVDSQDVKSKTTALGARVSHAASLSWGVLMPTAHAEWVHEYNDSNRDIIARFAQDPNGISFATPVDTPDNDYFNWGAGLSATLPAGYSLFVNYEAVTAQKYFSNQTVHLGARMEF